MESTKKRKTRNGLKTDVRKEQLVIGFGAQIIAFENQMHPVHREREREKNITKLHKLFLCSRLPKTTENKSRMSCDYV